MRLWTMSDLHLESTRFWDLPAPADRPDFDVMVVAGDLIPRMERGVKWLLERVSDRPVIYAMGNHEAYGVDVDRTVEKAKEAAAGSNVHVLQNETVRIGDTTFAVATLWTSYDLFGDPRRAMTVAADRMNDFKKIRVKGYVERFRPTHALARHKESRAFLESEMRKQRPGKLVVVTHHAPHALGLATSDPMTPDDILTASFRTDLTALMSPVPGRWHGPMEQVEPLRPPDVWIYGHTHESFDAVIGEKARVVSNAKGYGPWKPGETWENPHFNPNFVIEI
jgi:predicted phosphodiesterase